MNYCVLCVPTQDGDTAVILATLHPRQDALKELLRAGTDLNVQNNVRYLLYTASLICELVEVSLLVRPNSSDDLDKKLELVPEELYRYPAEWGEY